MAGPIVFIAALTAAAGLWVLVAGRGIGGYPRWPWRGAALRVAAAGCLLDSLVVVALAQTGHQGFAFMTYAAAALALAALAVMARRRALPS